MKVTHRTTITCKCPTNGDSDVYDAAFECCTTLPVETIVKAIEEALSEPRFQEDITQRLANALGVKVTTRGRHGRFETECVCD